MGAAPLHPLVRGRSQCGPKQQYSFLLFLLVQPQHHRNCYACIIEQVPLFFLSARPMMKDVGLSRAHEQEPSGKPGR